MASLKELIEEGEELAPQGGSFEREEENQNLQAEYFSWRIESLEALKQFGAPIDVYVQKNKNDVYADLFYFEKANELLGILKAAYRLENSKVVTNGEFGNRILLSDVSIKELANTIIGEGGNSPHRNVANLEEFLSLYIDTAEKHRYGSRFYHTERKLNEYNNSTSIEQIILGLLAPSQFVDSSYSVQDVVTHLNRFLRYDAWEVRPVGTEWEIVKREAEVVFRSPYDESSHFSRVFINQQIEKCDEKIVAEDYDGAITNARSMVEAVLKEIERDFDKSPPKHNGDLIALYKRVQRHLNLTPAGSLPDNLKQVLSGLTSLINGLASLRNTMGDAHALSYKPQKHHADLAVNSAKTICKFLYDSKNYQENKEK